MGFSVHLEFIVVFVFSFFAVLDSVKNNPIPKRVSLLATA